MLAEVGGGAAQRRPAAAEAGKDWFGLLLCQMFARKVQMFLGSHPCRRAGGGTGRGCPGGHGRVQRAALCPPLLCQRPRRLHKPCGAEMAGMAAATCSPGFLPRMAPSQGPPEWLHAAPSPCAAPSLHAPCPAGTARLCCPPGQCTLWPLEAGRMKAIAAPHTPGALQGSCCRHGWLGRGMPTLGALRPPLSGASQSLRVLLQSSSWVNTLPGLVLLRS